MLKAIDRNVEVFMPFAYMLHHLFSENEICHFSKLFFANSNQTFSHNRNIFSYLSLRTSDESVGKQCGIKV